MSFYSNKSIANKALDEVEEWRAERQREGYRGDPLVIRAKITRLIRDVIYERADIPADHRWRFPRRGAPPFLAIRHVSRLNQGNYGVKRSKCSVPLPKSHISRRDTFDVCCWPRESKNFRHALRERFYEPAARLGSERFYRRRIN